LGDFSQFSMAISRGGWRPSGSHVGIGSDLDGGCGFPGLDDVTRFPYLTEGMMSRGYSDDDSRKILGGNNLRVFKQVLK
jgi:membrane dipeptidase